MRTPSRASPLLLRIRVGGPEGFGECPAGFYCPEGTGLPIPTPRGFYAERKGTVSPARCLPGKYAPTLQTEACKPCPPGTACENDGMAVATICSPGFYRSHRVRR